MIPGIFAGAMGHGGGPTPGAQSFIFNSADKHANVSLSVGDLIATTTNNTGHFYARCNKPKNSGKWQFEFIVTQVSTASNAGNVSLGIAPTSTSPATLNPGLVSGSVWWGRGNDNLARIYSGGAESTIFAMLTASSANVPSTGAVCTVAVDFSTQEVSFYKNGALVYTNTFPAINPSTLNYVPAIKIWGSVGTPCIITIPATITHPVSGYTPWA